MIYIFIIATTLMLFNNQPILANSAEIEDIYQEVIVETPYYMETCQDTKANTQILDGLGSALKGDGSALVGGLIGGVVGNQIGKGTGKKVATGVGVIVGSNIGKNVQGPSSEICGQELRYRKSSEQRYSHSTIKFVSKGQEYVLEFQRR